MGNTTGTQEIARPARKPRRPRRRAAGRPTLDDAVELRSRILDVALEQFLALGFGAASIEGIARAARVNKDTLYRQFGTKEALYRESVRNAQLAMGHSMGEEVFAQPQDVASTLANVMRHLHRTFTTPQARRIVSMTVTQASLFPDLAAAASSESREYLQPLEDYLARLQRAGTLSLDDPQEAAHMLATVALGGVQFLFESTLPGAELDTFVQRRLVVLLRGWNFRAGAAAGPPAQS